MRLRRSGLKTAAALAVVLSAYGAAAAAEPAATARKASAWKTSATFGLETIYDDNFLRYSDDYLDVFHAGTDPYKFKIERQDCHILAPSFEVEARRELVALGETRLRFRWKRWQYVQESIKTNSGYSWYVRQFLPGGRSFELSYSYAPEQYIRQLSDEPPWEAPSHPLVWDEFRYTRNEFALVYRDRFSRDLTWKLDLSRTLRYYNQPFMENDIFSWGARGTLYWRARADWRVTFDYGFEHGPARGYDEVGESLEVSDNSDPSYDQDLYQVEVAWSPKWARRAFTSLALSGQYQAYWYTSLKSLDADPYHVGRKDNVYSLELTLDRPVAGGVDGVFGFKFSQRTVDSPWQGDIAEDKDYDQRRYWIGLSYKL